MTLNLGGHWSRFAAGAVLALLAQTLLVPSTVEASCGHYVVVGQLAEGKAMPAGVMPGGELPDGHSVPCSGPTCSGHSPVPLTPIKAVSPEAERWSATLSVLLLPEPSLASHLLAPEGARPTRRPSAIYHPPR
jgi:hypothetical protein